MNNAAAQPVFLRLKLCLPRRRVPAVCCRGAFTRLQPAPVFQSPLVALCGRAPACGEPRRESGRAEGSAEAFMLL